MTEAAAIRKAAALEKGDLRDGSAVGRFHIVVGASAGVALVGPLDTAADALARADTAMYAPKMERRRKRKPLAEPPPLRATGNRPQAMMSGVS